MPRKRARKNKRQVCKKPPAIANVAGSEEEMYKTPMILPLDPQGKIYILQDENGNTIGTGTRKVCEVLLYMITRAAGSPVEEQGGTPQKTNVRSAISI